MEDLTLPEIFIPAVINKSNPGEMDADGNYIFEVEASNENLDLQNQRIQQKALTDSEEFFLQDGVISDDHQHKKRLPNGEVESDKTKVIGEPISVRTEGTKTFVKGKLYGSVKAAKPFIDLLKAGSSRVKASVGGIMPRVIKHRDGTETVTSFMWNDLALTTSPVNWTVGPAHFAKSMTNVEFCKALTAGAGTDAVAFTGGRALQGEDIETKTVDVMDIKSTTPNEIEKSKEKIIQETIISIDTGELKTREDIEKFLIERGFSEDKARETTLEIIKQGGSTMAKSHFMSTMDDLLKSLAADKDADKEEKKEKKESVADDENIEEEIDLEENDDDTDDSADEKMEKSDCDKSDVEKSLKDEEEYVDVTQIMTDLNNELADMRSENAAMRAEISDLQKSLLDVTKSFKEYLAQPEERQTVMQKSISNNNVSNNCAVNKKPTVEDLDVFKSALTVAFKDRANNGLTLEKSQFLSSEFQKSLKGGQISQPVWSEICSIVHKYGK